MTQKVQTPKRELKKCYIKFINSIQFISLCNLLAYFLRSIFCVWNFLTIFTFVCSYLIRRLRLPFDQQNRHGAHIVVTREYTVRTANEDVCILLMKLIDI